MNSSLTMLIFLVAILIVGAMVLGVVMVTRKTTRSLDLNKYRSKWLRIEQLLSRDQPASYQLAILEADKLLDHALKESGIAGKTMGERMKTFNSRWSNANNAWNAHKLRNRIAHESDVAISFDQTRQVLGYFKQALKDVGAI